MWSAAEGDTKDGGQCALDALARAMEHPSFFRIEDAPLLPGDEHLAGPGQDPASAIGNREVHHRAFKSHRALASGDSRLESRDQAPGAAELLLAWPVDLVDDGNLRRMNAGGAGEAERAGPAQCVR
jgi:hypothetical protein